MHGIFSSLFSSVLHYDKQKTNDALGAYPEHVHVKALPERRYLKTSRVLALIVFVSIALNFAMGFIYMRMASTVYAVITPDFGSDTNLYRLDRFNNKIKPIQQSVLYLPARTLVTQNLIEEYLTQRYTMLPNYEVMLKRWGEESVVAYYVDKNIFTDGERVSTPLLTELRGGVIQDIYIYSINRVNTNLFEAWFDVFKINAKYEVGAVCPCFEKSKKCLECLRQKAFQTTRYRALMRVGFNAAARSREERVTNAYKFRIHWLQLNAIPIQSNDPWSDVDSILE